MAEDEDLEVLGAAVPVRSTTTDEQTDEGPDGEVDEIPHRPIVPGDPSANRVSDPHGVRNRTRGRSRKHRRSPSAPAPQRRCSAAVPPWTEKAGSGASDPGGPQLLGRGSHAESEPTAGHHELAIVMEPGSSARSS